MHVAAMTGQIKAFQIMFKKAVDKNPKDDNWDTPLHSAAKGGHYTICKLIIDAGIRAKNQRNKNDENPLELAISNNPTEVGLLFVILYWKHGIFSDLCNQLMDPRKRHHSI